MYKYLKKLLEELTLTAQETDSEINSLYQEDLLDNKFTYDIEDIEDSITELIDNIYEYIGEKIWKAKTI